MREDLLILVNHAPAGTRGVLSGEDGDHSGNPGGLICVDLQDAGVGVGTPKDFCVEHPGKGDVSNVDCPPLSLLGSIDLWKRPTYDLQIVQVEGPPRGSALKPVLFPGSSLNCRAPRWRGLSPFDKGADVVE